MPPKIQKLIQKNPYLRDWRQKTAVMLMLISMSEDNIINALQGNLDSPKTLKNVCDAEHLDYRQASDILGL